MVSDCNLPFFAVQISATFPFTSHPLGKLKLTTLVFKLTIADGWLIT